MKYGQPIDDSEDPSQKYSPLSEVCMYLHIPDLPGEGMESDRGILN
jgi:hypothetical protein